MAIGAAPKYGSAGPAHFVRTLTSPKTGINPSWRNGGRSVSLCGAYALSSASFACLGAATLAVYRRSGQMLFPLMCTEAVMCVSQSVTSYGNDTWTFTLDSHWKSVDRVHAFVFLMWQVAKPLWLWMSWPELAVWLATLAVAFYVFSLSHKAMLTDHFGARSFDVYLRMHTLWHLVLPAGIAVWLGLRSARALAEGEAFDFRRATFGAEVALEGWRRWRLF